MLGQICRCGVNMDSAQESLSQEKDSLAEKVMDNVGVSPENSDETSESQSESGNQTNNDPLYVQKRLKQQKRAHEREIRELHSRIGELQSMMSPTESPDQQGTSYTPNQGGGVTEQIQQAVSYALQHRDMEERKAKQAEQVAHVQRQYGELNRHLDNVADKYDDFDDVVRGQDVPITPHMRDAALFLPMDGKGSAGEVLYKLGKNRTELERIAKLHPLEQARELNRLSRSLEIGGGEENRTSQQRPLGNIKSNPVINSRSINEKTSISELRNRMKSGWK
jgi:hypothetical protein